MPAVAPAAAAAERRAHRARVARRLVRCAPAAVAALDWDALERAPDWLALSDVELATLQARIGAVLCAGVLRLWIDGARLAAAREVLGEAYLAALLAEPEAAAIATGLVALPRIDSAAAVGPALQAAGSSVLLAALPHGPLRQAVGAVFTAAVASPMTHELAASLVARAYALAHRAASRGTA